MSQPLVSIIIPAYNKAGTVEKAITSALGQTYGNVEVIVIDDASTDNTHDKCSGFTPAIRLYRNGHNIGLYNTRLAGLKLANGEYVTFLDADDWLNHDAIAICMDSAQRNNSDIVQMSIKRRVTRFNIPTGIRSAYDASHALDACLYNDRLFPVTCWSKLYRQEFISKVKHLGFNSFWGEDRIFNIPILSCKPKISVARQATYNYRWGGETVRCFNPSALEQYKSAYRIKLDWANENGYSCHIPAMDEELTALLNYHIRQMINSEEYSETEIMNFLESELASSFWAGILSQNCTAAELYSRNRKSFSRKIKKAVKKLL